MTEANALQLLRTAQLVDLKKLAFVVLPNGDHLERLTDSLDPFPDDFRCNDYDDPVRQVLF